MTRKSHIPYKLVVLALLFLSGISCESNISKITGVKISFTGQNVSNARVEFNSSRPLNAYLKYWTPGQSDQVFSSEISNGKENHSLLLTNLIPGQQYEFNIIASEDGGGKISGNYSFKTIDYSTGVKDTFIVECADPTLLSASYQEGYILVSRRENPGIIYLIDVKGNIVWFHQVKDAGFRVVNFTKYQTFLALLGTKEYDRSYGNVIMELSLKGDTLLYLKKGDKDFKQTIHHEILLNQKNEIVTLCNEDKILDLRSKGGSANDTIHGDGILVLDRRGRQVWKWTIFDALDPLQDKKIMKSKKDWMHANSISFDRDGNYLVSFYNNGQIWKIDAITGRVIWKFGKNGDFEIPARAVFDQAHAVHVNEKGWILFFDNGASKKLSRAMAFKIDELTKKAELIFSVWLPPKYYSERMGSSYLVNDKNLLYCSSGKKAILLTDIRGEILWQLNANRMVSYRAEFIPKENLYPFIGN